MQSLQQNDANATADTHEKGQQSFRLIEDLQSGGINVRYLQAIVRTNFLYESYVRVTVLLQVGFRHQEATRCRNHHDRQCAAAVHAGPPGHQGSIRGKSRKDP